MAQNQAKHVRSGFMDGPTFLLPYPDRSAVYMQCSFRITAVYTVHRLHGLCSVENPSSQSTKGDKCSVHSATLHVHSTSVWDT